MLSKYFNFVSSLILTLDNSVLVLGLRLGEVSAVLVSSAVLVRERLGGVLLLHVRGGVMGGVVVGGWGRGVCGRGVGSGGRVVGGGGVWELGSSGSPDEGKTNENLQKFKLNFKKY